MKFLTIALAILFTGLNSDIFALDTDKVDSVPELNRKVIEFVKTKINQRVGKGECWDLAAQALDKNNALWDHKYKYGRKIDPQKEQVYPGDMIQFEGVVVKFRKGNSVYQETMQHHTAVVWEVKEKNVFLIAHQNNHFSGKKVGISELDLNTVIKGKMYFYRPVK